MASDPAEEQSCCGCLHVEYALIDLKDGYMQERWRCTLCETEFVRFNQVHALRQRVAELEQQRDGLAEVVTDFCILHAKLVIGCQIDNWPVLKHMTQASKTGQALLEALRAHEEESGAD